MNLKTIIKTIRKGRVFLVTTHVHPDPDGLCSELAMAMYLRSLGKKVYVINEEDIPERFLFFPKSKLIQKIKPKQRLEYDVAVILDCGDLGRIGGVADLIREDKPIINIDHHITNDRFGNLNFIQPKASSTTEMLFDLFRQTKCKLTKDMAVLLYLGMMTDTGSFRYDNTTSRTHGVISELLKFRFSVSNLYKKLYETVPYNDLKFFMEVARGVQLLYGGRVAAVELQKKIVDQFSQEFDLREKLFTFLRSIKGVEVLVIFTEHKNKITRVNFRSQGKADVARVSSFFKGGGHKKASGCVVAAGMKTTKTKVLAQIRKVL